ncbi:threonylcarbamoyladenosine tRNA methylthiotransferase-like isoform X2 [Corticium candelabrum]|uniref:threonylcarbamoyladenosine tRNA methylthiotransferase-like isoform X2 n=1 Tax=Corticium candelabrum TaxID=121492 RepID=UPI002E27158A|nr:threonylcarbamoyladenosine tRNA methylthiotransferase-like isoform X2 [Corticium candelabrum]
MQNVSDIEDIVTGEDNGDRKPNRRNVLPKRLRRREALCEKSHVTPSLMSNIPAMEKVYIKTWGCSHNNSDGEYIAGQLSAFGYFITDDPELSDLWVLNSCTVKNPSEDSFINAVQKAHELNKHIVLAGCVPQAQKDHKMLKGLSAIGVQQIDRIVDVVEETLKGNTVRLFGSKRQNGRRVGGADLSLPKIRKNPLIEIIAINTGCLNNCTYCKTKQSRGDLASYQPEEIISRARQSFEGVREIWLTSEDTGAYGRDIGVTLPELLNRLVEVIPEGAMLRLGMTNPPYILDHLEEMAQILSHSRVYSFLHIPVQSASDSVLADMKREYTIEDFKHVVDFLNKQVPGITIATDVICGFPTETPEDFSTTLSLVQEYKFPSLFINQFYPRPGTPAARMKRIPTEIVKQRTREISKLFQSYKPYDHKVGERQTVLVTEEAHDRRHYVAHNKFYEQVLVPMDDTLLGCMIDVEIVSATKHSMEGKLCGLALTSHSCLPPSLGLGEITSLSDRLTQTGQNRFVMKQRRWNVGSSFVWTLLQLLVVSVLSVVVLMYW